MEWTRSGQRTRSKRSRGRNTEIRVSCGTSCSTSRRDAGVLGGRKRATTGRAGLTRPDWTYPYRPIKRGCSERMRSSCCSCVTRAVIKTSIGSLFPAIGLLERPTLAKRPTTSFRLYRGGRRPVKRSSGRGSTIASPGGLDYRGVNSADVRNTKEVPHESIWQHPPEARFEEG